MRRTVAWGYSSRNVGSYVDSVGDIFSIVIRQFGASETEDAISHVPLISAPRPNAVRINSWRSCSNAVVTSAKGSEGSVASMIDRVQNGRDCLSSHIFHGRDGDNHVVRSSSFPTVSYLRWSCRISQLSEQNCPAYPGRSRASLVQVSSRHSLQSVIWRYLDSENESCHWLVTPLLHQLYSWSAAMDSVRAPHPSWRR